MPPLLKAFKQMQTELLRQRRISLSTKFLEPMNRMRAIFEERRERPPALRVASAASSGGLYSGKNLVRMLAFARWRMRHLGISRIRRGR
jgi:hypothetical protein